METQQGATLIAETPSTSQTVESSASTAETTARPSVSQESSIECDDEQPISREDNKIYMENYQYNFDALTQERNEIEKAVKNKQITPGRAKLQLWLYRSMRIVMTDGRILIGIFLCTDSDANVILGVCSEYTKSGGDERMLGLVMVPGTKLKAMRYTVFKMLKKKILKLFLLLIFRTAYCYNALGHAHIELKIDLQYKST